MTDLGPDLSEVELVARAMHRAAVSHNRDGDQHPNWEHEHSLVRQAWLRSAGAAIAALDQLRPSEAFSFAEVARRMPLPSRDRADRLSTGPAYDDGYRAGLRCDPIPDHATDEWQLGYAVALDIDRTIATGLVNAISEDDPRIEMAAQALAKTKLTDHGRASFNWINDFSETERHCYRQQVIIVMEVINA